ncbi:hypothetical protein GCM10009775_04470 [Microbacterium aoyamense]|uniref:Uncharacterized protein n=1 Tax=Microbacterium aoyamense TaxID=344166 RepID=A0ABN2P894_9MICO|nr:hypothetical protein [Microbacterium aoyamense]
MTILCITNTGIPGIRRCTIRGKHGILCPDREVNRAIAEHQGAELGEPTCGGCLPRKADHGFLCNWCWERVEAAQLEWPRFARLVVETEGRAVSAEGGGIKGSTPDGYTNLPLTMLLLDECTRLLRSRAGATLDAWVHTEAGARDAIMFAHSAERAFRSVEVESKPLQLERVRCPHCGQLALFENRKRKVRGATVVECENCGEELDKIRDDAAERWHGSEACEHGHHDRCRSLSCPCDCHQRTSSLYTIQTPAHLIERNAS